MLVPERYEGTPLLVPIVQYCADALGTVTAMIPPTKMRAASSRHISPYSFAALAVQVRERLSARIERRQVQRGRVRRVATTVRRHARIDRRRAAVIAASQRVRRVRLERIAALAA